MSIVFFKEYTTECPWIQNYQRIERMIRIIISKINSNYSSFTGNCVANDYSRLDNCCDIIKYTYIDVLLYRIVM